MTVFVTLDALLGSRALEILISNRPNPPSASSSLSAWVAESWAFHLRNPQGPLHVRPVFDVQPTDTPERVLFILRGFAAPLSKRCISLPALIPLVDAIMAGVARWQNHNPQGWKRAHEDLFGQVAFNLFLAEGGSLDLPDPDLSLRRGVWM